jgi:hypothetical protein
MMAIECVCLNYESVEVEVEVWVKKEMIMEKGDMGDASPLCERSEPRMTRKDR